MQISTRMLSLLVLSQAFWRVAAIEARLVRSTSKVVGADGMIMDESPADEMSVSAHGEVGGILPNGDMVDASLIESRSTSAEDMLAEVETLVKSKDSGNRDKIAEIQKLAQDLLAEVKDDRDKEAAEVPINLKTVETCNSGSTSRQQGIKSNTEKTVGSSRDTHATCREDEKKKEEHKNGRCGELDTFLEAIKTPAAKPAGRDPAVKWVEGESSYWCEQGPTVTGLNEACKKAEKEHGDHQADCNKKQGAFELGFCTWRTELLDACRDLTTCYEDAVDNYNKHVEITKKLVTKLKTEYKSLKKILCYVDVWMNDENTATVDASQYAKCQALDPTDDANTALDIDYGKVPAKVACDTAPVQTHPGTQEFPNVEYSKFTKYAITPIACLPRSEPGTEETTAEATTTTAEPTTTTAGPTTPAHYQNAITAEGPWKLVHWCTHCGWRGTNWESKSNEQECGARCDGLKLPFLIYNHKYDNCRCYAQDDCHEDNRVTTEDPECHYHVYGH